MDELGFLAPFVGPALEKSAGLTRGLGLRLLLACQHGSQLPQSLQDSLFGNAGVRVFFRLGDDDADIISRRLAVGQTLPTKSLRLDAEPNRQTDSMFARVLDAEGRQIEVDEEYRESLDGSLGTLLAVAASVKMGRLYVFDRGMPVELREYVQGASDVKIHPGPPVKVQIIFPAVRVTKSETYSKEEVRDAWKHRLMNLPIGECLILEGDKTAAHVAVRQRSPKAYILRNPPPPDRSGKGAMETQRQQAIDRLCGKVPSIPTSQKDPVPNQVDEKDDSIA